MNTLDIVLINIISYMGGLCTAFGIFLRYKQALLIKTHSHAQLKDLVNNLTTDLQNKTSLGPPTPPIMASAPPPHDIQEIVIRNT
tara:strand:- start:726 stop:980 length:255 start_codon:yes stop_codon:yes gene_type:complete